MMVSNCIHFSASNIKISSPFSFLFSLLLCSPPHLSSPLYCCLCLSFDRICVVQPNLKLELLLPQPSSCWDFRYRPPPQLSVGYYFCSCSHSAPVGVLSTASWVGQQVQEIKWLFRGSRFEVQIFISQKADAVSQHALPSY